MKGKLATTGEAIPFVVQDWMSGGEQIDYRTSQVKDTQGR